MPIWTGCVCYGRAADQSKPATTEPASPWSCQPARSHSSKQGRPLTQCVAFETHSCCMTLKALSPTDGKLIAGHRISSRVGPARRPLAAANGLTRAMQSVAAIKTLSCAHPGGRVRRSSPATLISSLCTRQAGQVPVAQVRLKLATYSGHLCSLAAASLGQMTLGWPWCACA
jgi:hypothetical protein